ncbi:hypothetical protein D3C81_1083360 [compost metagenome]
MVAGKRQEGADLDPSRKQLRRRNVAWRFRKATDIIADKRNTGQTDVCIHRDRHLQMFPVAYVVAGPERRVALRSCVHVASQHKWAGVRFVFEVAVIGRFSFMMSIKIVIFRMGYLLSIVVFKHDIQRHRMERAVKYGRLVHIIPNAVNSLV